MDKVNNEFGFPFERFEVWQLAVEFADNILELLETFAPNKHLRLIGQMEAAVCSIAQNIAEGNPCNLRNLWIKIRKKAEIIDRKLHGLINSLKSR